MPNIEKDALELQSDLFHLIGEFWGRATGALPGQFATVETFSKELKKNSLMISHRAEDALSFADTELRQFYAKNGAKMFETARRLGGAKVVLGGSSRFGRTQLSAVSGSLLYVDTSLIPDPVLPWLEAPRANERFKMVWMLQAAHTLLQLRPIVDAELPHCPVFVFPSWEKSLEEHDLVTMAGIGQLVTDVLAAHVDSGITSLDEAMEFVKRNPGKLVDRAGTNALLVVPGGPIGGPSERVLTDYEAEIGKWRSVEAMARFRALSPDEKALNILFERLGPQYHLLENSDELSAHPLVSVPQQAHYFRVVAGTNNCRLEKLGLLEKKTAAVVSAFGTARLAWISKVSPEALIEIRGNNENEAFRKTLRAALTDLQDSALEDTDRVAAEVCREIDSAIADHQRQVRDSERINRRSKVTWAAGLLAAGASSMVPQLAPFLGKILPFGVAAKAAWDLYCVNSDRRRRARSLMGILAVLRDQDE